MQFNMSHNLAINCSSKDKDPELMRGYLIRAKEKFNSISSKEINSLISNIQSISKVKCKIY